MDRLVLSASRVLDFVQKHMPLNAVAGMQGIGLERNGELIAGVLFEGNNGRNVWMHAAANKGRVWATRMFVATCFGYAFTQCGVSRVSAYIEDHNVPSKRFVEHLGFQKEAVLPGAASDGGDILIYRMLRSECKYVNS